MVKIDCIVCGEVFDATQLNANGVCKPCDHDHDCPFIYGFNDDDFRDAPYDERDDWEGDDWEEDDKW